MFDVGRVCVKIAGRDAGKKCVVVQVLDDKFVMIDGDTRRRKCNKMHLEAMSETVDIKENASHAEVAKALSTKERKTTPKQKFTRITKTRKTKKATENTSEKKTKKETKKSK